MRTAREEVTYLVPVVAAERASILPKRIRRPGSFWPAQVGEQPHRRTASDMKQAVGIEPGWPDSRPITTNRKRANIDPGLMPSLNLTKRMGPGNGVNCAPCPPSVIGSETISNPA